MAWASPVPSNGMADDRWWVFLSVGRQTQIKLVAEDERECCGLFLDMRYISKELSPSKQLSIKHDTYLENASWKKH
jgi:hypothetical protein